MGNHQDYERVESAVDRAIVWLRTSPWSAVIVALVIVLLVILGAWLRG